MIENYKIEIDETTKIKKIKKSNLIVRLSILGAFLLTVLITAIVIFAGAKVSTVGITGEGGVRSRNGKVYTYKEFEFVNIKDDNSIEIINAEDFVLERNGNRVHGSLISTGNLENASDEYKLIYDGKDKYIKVYFEGSYYGSLNFYFKGELLDYVSNSNDAGGTFGGALIIEFLIFGFIFAFVSAKLSGRLFAKNGERYKAINEKIVLKLKEIDFKTTKTFALSGRQSGSTEIEKMLIFVDGKNKKFAFVDYSKKLFKVVDYKDLVNYKLIEKNGTDIGSQLHYSIILDSAYTTTSSRDVCKKLQLVLVLNDEEDSTIIYELVKSSLGMDTDRYKRLSNEMIELTAFLDIVEKNTPKDKRFIYCKHCGTKNDYDAKKCSSCGAAID